MIPSDGSSPGLIWQAILAITILSLSLTRRACTMFLERGIWRFSNLDKFDIHLKPLQFLKHRWWQEYQEKIKLYCQLFLRQHSPVPVQAGFF